MNEQLKIFLLAKDDELENTSDAMWFNMMHDSVTEYNKANKTNFDPYDSIMEYVESEFTKQPQ